VNEIEQCEQVRTYDALRLKVVGVIVGHHTQMTRRFAALNEPGVDGCVTNFGR
jgi:hypothetical protein